MILQFAPFIDQISVPVLGGFVVPLVDVESLKKCSAMVKVGLSRFQKPIGELVRNPFVVASYFLKLSLEIRSVLYKKTTTKKNASNTYISKFFQHIKSCRT